jgi:Protein of unknown function (DUF3175)
MATGKRKTTARTNIGKRKPHPRGVTEATKRRRRLRRAKDRTWSAKVNEHSNALDLKSGIFSSDSPRSIARSLKRSAEASKRRKSTPFRSAMSMLNFYINRGGKGLSKQRRDILERAKPELRKLFGRA